MDHLRGATLSFLNQYATAFRQWSTSRPRRLARRRQTPLLEALEPIELLSLASLWRLARHPTPLFKTPALIHKLSAASMPVSTAMQTVTVTDTLTNFTLPFAPPAQLFNPALGTLTSVDVTSAVSISSSIKSQNTSTVSPTVITAHVSGAYQINGLSAPITGTSSKSASRMVTAFPGGPIDFTGPSAAIFPSLSATDSKTFTLTDSASLAFFTASAGRSSITLTLAEQGASDASAPNGNLQTQVRTSGSGTVTLVYHYASVCPTITNIVRYGIHYQPTVLAVTFSQPVNPADAQNVKNYKIVAHDATGTHTVSVASAVYNSATNTVRLTTARQVNLHYINSLVVNLPGCPTPIVGAFGGKASLGGYGNKAGQFVTYPGYGPLPTL